MSAKLVDRGERIVMEVTGVERAEARSLIDRAGGSVRTAIVMQQRGLSREAAERALRDAGGVVRRVLPHAPPPVE
jgi:N-acetylmuramic acid 6-phosphate etherase